MAQASDTLIFRVSPHGLSLVGGSGRGVGWSGIVDLPMDREPLAARVLNSARSARVGGNGDPVRIVGPYWAKNGLLVPVGGEHLVVFGGEEPLPDPDATLIPKAAQLVAELGQVSPAKLLADELEVVHAMRDLMEYRPERIDETARHVATKAAEALSCDVGAILVRNGEALIAEVITRDWPAQLDATAIKRTLTELFKRTEQRGPILELELEAEAGDALGRDQGLVARFALPIGEPRPFGVLVVAHAAIRARGFTNLCQRIGHALADAAESLLVQAMSRQELASERDRFAREARIDPLTGLGNRTAWLDFVAYEEGRRARHPRPVSIVSADLDNLKAVNDQFGHAAGDALLCAAADILRRTARRSDRIARVGGDEFLVMMPETSAAGAARFLVRLRAALRRVRFPEGLSISLGAATARKGEGMVAVVARADAAMYAAKKRRQQRPSHPAAA
jgi:diguanylate cyclase (GGDEF)-like protein